MNFIFMLNDKNSLPDIPGSMLINLLQILQKSQGHCYLPALYISQQCGGGKVPPVSQKRMSFYNARTQSSPICNKKYLPILHQNRTFHRWLFFFSIKDCPIELHFLNQFSFQKWITDLYYKCLKSFSVNDIRV